jgi:hypothetical protein
MFMNQGDGNALWLMTFVIMCGFLGPLGVILFIVVFMYANATNK